MDSLGIFILLMLLCFHWRAAPAGKVLINILISIVRDLFCFDFGVIDCLGDLSCIGAVVKLDLSNI